MAKCCGARFAVIIFMQIIMGAALAEYRPAQKLDRESLIAELTGRTIKKETDKSLFVEVLRGYQGENWLLMERNLQALLSTYSQSSMADNGLYLAGLYHFQRRKYGLAIQYFNRVINEYPNSEKAVSSVFAKGVTYRAMGLPDLAKDSLNKVVKKYPGSPESLRAQLEMRMLRE